MKSFMQLWIVIFFAAFSYANAQSESDSARVQYRKWQVEQRRTVQKFMKLAEYQKEPFWTIYDSYCRAIEYLEVEYFQVVELHDRYSDQITDDQERMLANILLKNDCFLAQARRQYFRKFQRTLSSSQASEFMRLDNSLRTVYRLNLQKNNPMMDRAAATVYSLNTP